MDLENRQRIQKLFDEALAAAPDQRAALLDRVCEGQPQLREEIESLLAAHQGAGAFISDPTLSISAISGLLSQEPEGGEPIPAFKAGDRIGRYKLLEKIGEGGFGIVYLAEQEEPVRRRVALKVIKIGMDTQEVIARFEAERQALAMMDHPNIASVHDAGSTETGRPYFVMELVRGVPITQYADLNGLDTRERLDLFQKVCAAVQHAHQKGVIHRDLKPSNILVTLNDGVPIPKIIDFGIAKATNARLTEKTVYTRFHQLMGTPAYMSPEQAEMSTLDVDTRSDIYSLGVLLYEFLTGNTPFDSGSLAEAGYAEIQRIIREVEPPKPSTRVSTGDAAGRTAVARQRKVDSKALARLLRGELDWIVMKALEKDRTRRYETATDLARDVGRFLRSEPVEAGPPSWTYRTRKLLLRRRKALLTMGVVLSALILGLAAALVGLAEARREAQLARTAETNERNEHQQAELARAAEKKERERAQEKEAKAVREAEKARRVLGLIEEMFNSVNPIEERGKDFTVRALLDDFCGRFGQELNLDPEVEIQIRLAVVRAYNGIQVPGIAQQHAERALALAEKSPGESQINLIQALLDMGVVLNSQYRSESAEPFLVRALDLSQQQLGAESWVAAECAGHLGIAYFKVYSTSRSRPLLSKAVEIKSRMLGRDHWETLNFLRVMADLESREGHLPVAEKLYHEILELSSHRYGETSLITMFALQTVADYYKGRGLPSEEKSLRSRVLESQRKLLGDEHFSTIKTMRRLSQIHLELGEDPKALTLLQEVEAHLEKLIERRMRSLGGEHPDTLEAIHEHASALRDLRRYQEAEKQFLRLLEIDRRNKNVELIEWDLGSLDKLYIATEDYEKLRQVRQQNLALHQPPGGGENRITLNNRCQIANTFMKQKRFAEGVAAYEEVLSHARNTFGEEDLDTLNYSFGLANWYPFLGRYREAEELLQKVIRGRTKVYGEAHQQTLIARETLATHFKLKAHSLEYHSTSMEAEVIRWEILPLQIQLIGAEHPEMPENQTRLVCELNDQGEFQEADAISSQALELARKVLARGDSDLPDVLLERGRTLLGLGRADEAESLLGECLSLQKDPMMVTAQVCQSVLGACLIELGKLEEAEGLLIEAYDCLETLPFPPYRRWKRDNLERLVRLYRKWGRAEEAAVWSARLDVYPPWPKIEAMTGAK